MTSHGLDSASQAYLQAPPASGSTTDWGGSMEHEPWGTVQIQTTTNMLLPLFQGITSLLHTNGHSQVSLVIVMHLLRWLSWPHALMLWQKLKELYIENNQLEQLPASLGLMPNLEVLDCRHNLLKQLPDAICHAQGEELPRSTAQ